MQYDVRSFKASDGAAIRYATVGRGPPLVLVISWKTTMAAQLVPPEAAPFYACLSRHRALTLFNRRGVGESRDAALDLTRDRQVSDIADLVETLGIGSHDVLADNDGCYVAAAYAASHRDVRRMALWSPLVTGEDAAPERLLELASRMRAEPRAAYAGWARGVLPGGDESARERWVETTEAAISPNAAVAYLEWEAAEDIAPLLPTIGTPVMVLSSRRGGRRSMGVSSLLPRARFEAVDVDPASGRMNMAEIAERIVGFLDEPT